MPVQLQGLFPVQSPHLQAKGSPRPQGQACRGGGGEVNPFLNPQMGAGACFGMRAGSLREQALHLAGARGTVPERYAERL